MALTLSDIQRKYGESVFPLYKDEMHEPYMELDKRTGYHGIQGAVLYDEDLDKVQCSVCEVWMENLNTHITNLHGIKIDEYREIVSLPKNIPLCSVGYSLKLSKRSSESYTISGKKKNWGATKGKTWSNETNVRRGLSVKKAKGTVGFKNKFGLCDAQVAARLVVIQKITDKDNITLLTTSDLITHDYKLYSHLREKWGTVRKACLKLGIKYGRESKFDDAQAIADLRTFVKTNKRVPRIEEMKRSSGTFSKNTYTNHFGSWRRAKMMAGLDQLLQEVKTSRA